MLKRIRNLHLANKIFQTPEETGYSTKLLSRKSIERFGKLVQWIALMGSVPFNWNDKKGTMIPERRVLVRLFGNFLSGYQFLNTVYLLLTFASLALDKTIKLTDVDFFLHFVFTASYVFNCVLTLNLYVNKKEIVCFLNRFIEVIYKLEGQEMKNTRKPTKFEKWLYLFPIAACLQIPMGFTMHTIRPFATFYMVTSVTDEVNYNFLVHGISLVFETFVYTSQWFRAIFFVCYTYTYILVTASWAKKLKKKLTKSPRLIHLSRYRMLQLLNKQFNDSISDIAMCGHKVIIFVLTVTSSYAIMHFYHQDIYIYVTYCIVLAIMIIFQYIAYLPASSLYKDTGKIHKMHLPQKQLKEYQQKFLKSCAPLKIQVGPFYYFKHHTPLKFFKAELVYTVKVHYYILK